MIVIPRFRERISFNFGPKVIKHTFSLSTFVSLSYTLASFLCANENILFIATGAFVGLEEIIKKRMGTNKIGFEKLEKETFDVDNALSYVTADDIREFGMIPEFVGRFPIITNTNELSEDDLVKILTEPKNALIKQYSELLRYDNTILNITKGGLKEIAHIASTLGTGARGLRHVVETVLFDAMYNAPDNKDKRKPVKQEISEDYVRERGEPLLKDGENGSAMR